MTDYKALRETLERMDREATAGEWEYRGQGAISARLPQTITLPSMQITTSLTPVLRNPDGWAERCGEDGALIVSLRNSLPQILAALRLAELAKPFHDEIEHLLDWMNGNDTVSDYADQHPEEFQRQCDALEALSAALKFEQMKDEP
jgi:hypothetical protein